MGEVWRCRSRGSSLSLVRSPTPWPGGVRGQHRPLGLKAENSVVTEDGCPSGSNEGFGYARSREAERAHRTGSKFSLLNLEPVVFLLVFYL